MGSRTFKRRLRRMHMVRLQQELKWWWDETAEVLVDLNSSIHSLASSNTVISAPSLCSLTRFSEISKISKLFPSFPLFPEIPSFRCDLQPTFFISRLYSVLTFPSYPHTGDVTWLFIYSPGSYFPL